MDVCRRLGALALAQVAALVLILVAIDGDWQPPAAQPPEIPAPPAPAGDAAVGSDLVADIAARPLFLATRRPPEPSAEATVAEAPPPDPLADVALVGIYGSGADAGILLRKGTEISRLRADGQWQGWRLLSLGATEVTLTAADGATKTLKLERRPQVGGMVARPVQGKGKAAPGAVRDKADPRAQRTNTANGAAQAGGQTGSAAAPQAALRARMGRARLNSSE
ncbi:hypothetical protein [Immundisolibacter sp.]|uniref:hypothetical protein n=1 Tax=Immundisolibacter sp. TaxID=1934948 RepID=UPI002615BEFA|nr:hypothetical protein [Immundisolibacter sp.]MDD3650716.1 hypothetical protein [Immundisolibacter sp.]